MILKERVQQCFNKGAETYDVAAEVQRIIANSLAQRLANISANRILEIGCGTGLLSQCLLRQFPRASFLLTDIASDMTQVCRQRFAEYANVDVVCMDGEMLATAATFDLIVSSMTLHWMTNIQESLNQFVEKLAPGGHFIFAMLGENSLHEWRVRCEAMHVASATPIFPSYDFIQQSVLNLQLQKETYQHRYESAYAFLKSIKQLGATATHENYLSLSSGQLRRLMRSFSEEMNITYEIIYGFYQKT